MNKRKPITKWNVKFIDSLSGGKVQETSITGYYDYNDVVEFFGLRNPDVSWYDIEMDEEYNKMMDL